MYVLWQATAYLATCSYLYRYRDSFGRGSLSLDGLPEHRSLQVAGVFNDAAFRRAEPQARIVSVFESKYLTPVIPDLKLVGPYCFRS